MPAFLADTVKVHTGVDAGFTLELDLQRVNSLTNWRDPLRSSDPAAVKAALAAQAETLRSR